MPFQNLFLGRAKLSFEPSIISCLRNRSNGMIFQAEYSEELARVTPAQTLHPIESRPSQRKTRPPYLSLSLFLSRPRKPRREGNDGYQQKTYREQTVSIITGFENVKVTTVSVNGRQSVSGSLVGLPALVVVYVEVEKVVYATNLQVQGLHFLKREKRV